MSTFSSAAAIGANFQRAMVATAPGEKTPHRAPPCEDPRWTRRTISSFFAENYIFLEKSSKNSYQQSCSF